MSAQQNQRPVPRNPSGKNEEEEEKAAEKLAKPPKDRREITIAPSNETGPDVALE